MCLCAIWRTFLVQLYAVENVLNQNTAVLIVMFILYMNSETALGTPIGYEHHRKAGCSEEITEDHIYNLK